MEKGDNNGKSVDEDGDDGEKPAVEGGGWGDVHQGAEVSFVNEGSIEAVEGAEGEGGEGEAGEHEGFGIFVVGEANEVK